MSTKDTGDRGENAACVLLESKGYEIVERNYHSRRGEVDIICKNDDYIVFVEVKTRKKSSMVSGCEAVDAVKRKKVFLTAVKFLSENPCELQPRFDVISVVEGGETEHIENAFGSEVCDEVF